jgi:hypothetical protein
MRDRTTLAATLTQHQALRLDALSVYVTALPVEGLTSWEVVSCLLYDLEVLRARLQPWTTERDV